MRRGIAQWVVPVSVGIAVMAMCCCLGIGLWSTPQVQEPQQEVSASVAPSPSMTEVEDLGDDLEDVDTPHVYYANCDQVRRAGQAPLYIGEPGYRKGLDRDGDGKACDR